MSFFGRLLGNSGLNLVSYFTRSWIFFLLYPGSGEMRSWATTSVDDKVPKVGLFGHCGRAGRESVGKEEHERYEVGLAG